MTEPGFERARSAAAKRQREQAILDAARGLGATRGVRAVTLTDLAEAVGMHKSALLRYFETREQIFLLLTADGWQEWSAALLHRLAAVEPGDTAAVAEAFAATLVARPLFCDLLAHVPLNLERHVSVESVRAFKLVSHEAVDAIVAALQRLLPLSAEQGVDIVATATSMAGAQWQMATPPAEIAALYRSDPRLAHAVVEVEPRLVRVLSALLRGMVA
jgi:AcrR family transcriptional regulator